MMDRIEQHVRRIFSPYQKVKSAQELEEELTQNLKEKFNDLKQKGHSDEEAYRYTIDSIGEVSELINSIQLQHDDLEAAVQMNYSMQSLRESDFRSVAIYGGKFNHSDLRKSDFSHSDLTKSTFKSSDLSDCLFHEVNLTEVTFLNTTLKGSSFTSCRYDRTLFKRAQLARIDFVEQSFLQTVFEHCDMGATSFRDATFKNVQFRNCDVKRAKFSGAAMDKLTYNFLAGSKADLSLVHIIE